MGVILFAILLALMPGLFIVDSCVISIYGVIKKVATIGNIIVTISFYVPNILQTLLILLMWPINFYFVKTCVFVLVLSLTRNISYFTDEVPNDFLATSTAFVQYVIRDDIDKMRNKNVDETQKMINEV